MNKKEQVLVTGGAGFLGSHLCKYLLNKNKHVICVDNLFTGNKENIKPLLANPYFEFIRHDITQPLFVEVDRIFNLACPASPIHYQNDAVQTVKTSVLGTINMLGLAKRLNAPFFQASTSEVYGEPAIHPQPESYHGNVNPIGIRACYDEGKRCAETLCFDYYRQHNVNIKVARIFNTYGPNMSINDGRVISNFIVQALQNKPISIYGDGLQTRSFCYVDDLIDAMYSFMYSENNLTGPINLGNPKEVSIKEIAEKILLLTNSSSKISYFPLPQNDPLQRKPDIKKAKESLNWNPEISLETGLNKTIDYFKSIL